MKPNSGVTESNEDFDREPSQTGNQVMRVLQGLIILFLMLVSSNYRRQMREAADRLSEANDEVEASLHRLDALRNGGRPKLRVLPGDGST